MLSLVRDDCIPQQLALFEIVSEQSPPNYLNDESNALDSPSW